MRLALRLAADLYAGRASSMRPTGLRQDRRGEGDVDGQAAAGPGFRGDGGAVGGGDSPDDGQAEAVAAAAAGGARAEPLEGLEQAVDVGGRDDLPGVAHRQDGVTAAGPGGDLDIPAGDVVPDGVVDQVGYQLLNQERVTVEDGGLDVGVDVRAEAADPGLGGGQGSAGDVRQIQGLALAGVGLAAGQGEQRLDEAFLLGVGGEQLLADSPPGAGGARRVGEGDLEQGAFPRQRGAQLVRGVGGETPLGVERGLQTREQVVEGVGEFLELVVGSVQGQPLVQAAGGDPPGGGGDRAQRAQHPAGDDPADRRGGRPPPAAEHRAVAGAAPGAPRQEDGADDHDLPLVVVDLKLRIGEQLSPLGGGEGRRPLKLPAGGDGHRGVDYVVATCVLNVGDGDFDADSDYVVGTCVLNVGDGDFVRSEEHTSE